MPAPKLATKKGRKIPEWNLTPAALAKEQQSFREESAAFLAARPKLRAARPRKGRKPSARLTRSLAAVSTLVTLRADHLDLVTDSKLFDELKPLLQLGQRKNQKDMTPTEWAALVGAINAVAAPGAQSPTYQEFVHVHHRAMDMGDHQAMTWGVHTMMGHPGVNFLAWHREYLAKLEARLILVNPLVRIPYWNWIEERAVPQALSDPADLQAWGVTRGTFNPNGLPVQSDIDAVKANAGFAAFQTALERPHGWVHNAVGGTMATGDSPADPLFWLHHAFVDKIWDDWQKAHAGAPSKPPNVNDTLQPAPIITHTVAEVLDTSALGYVYV
jgi:tyrosinase